MWTLGTVLSKRFWQWLLIAFHLLGPWCKGHRVHLRQMQSHMAALGSVGSTWGRLSMQPVHLQLAPFGEFPVLLAAQGLGCSSVGRKGSVASVCRVMQGRHLLTALTGALGWASGDRAEAHPCHRLRHQGQGRTFNSEPFL